MNISRCLRPRFTTALAGALLAGAICVAARPAAAAPSGAPAPAVYSARALSARAEAELASGHPGPALLDWQRARLLAPRSPAIAAGIEKARAAAGVPSPRPPLWQRVAGHLSPDEWAWVGVVGLICAAAALVAFGWGALRWAVRTSVLAAGLAVGALGFVAASVQAPPPDQAVVLAPDLVARIAPFAKADAAFALPEGATVSLRGVHGGYALVVAPGGEGWIPRDDVETIVPHPEHRI